MLDPILSSPLGPFVAPSGGASAARPVWAARLDRMSRYPGAPASFERAGARTYIGPDGLMHSAAVDEATFPARWDGTSWRRRGLAVHPGRTNLMLHNDALDGGGWGGGAIVARDAVGLDGLAGSAFTVSDPSTEVSLRLQQLVSIPADNAPVAMRWWIRRDAAATAACLVGIRLLNAANTRENLIFDPATGDNLIHQHDGTFEIVAHEHWWEILQSVANDGTASEADVQLWPAWRSDLAAIGVDNAAAGAVVTCLPELHAGVPRVAGGPITSGATPGSSEADLADVDLAGVLLGAATLAVGWESTGDEGELARVVELNDGTADNVVALVRAGSNVQFNVVAAGQLVVNVNLGAWSAGRHGAALRLAADDFAGALDGQPTVSVASAAMPTLDRLLLGRSIGSYWLDGVLRSAALWDRPLADGALRALSVRA